MQWNKRQMTQNQHKRQITSDDLGKLHSKEIELIWLIRTKYRFGTIELYLRDGLPEDILKTVERHRLGTGVEELSTT